MPINRRSSSSAACFLAAAFLAAALRAGDLALRAAGLAAGVALAGVAAFAGVARSYKAGPVGARYACDSSRALTPRSDLDHAQRLEACLLA